MRRILGSLLEAFDEILGVFTDMVRIFTGDFYVATPAEREGEREKKERERERGGAVAVRACDGAAGRNTTESIAYRGSRARLITGAQKVEPA